MPFKGSVCGTLEAEDAEAAEDAERSPVQLRS